MVNIVPTPLPADPVAGQGGHLAWSTWAKAAILALDAVLPAGLILPYGGTVAPEGWHLCNGTAHGSVNLQAVIGSPNAPDLRGKFIVGAGGSYAVGATGGADTVALSVANMPAHNHGGVTASGNATHSHSTSSDGSHVHGTRRGGGGTEYPVHSVSEMSGGWSSLDTDAGGIHGHTISWENAPHVHSIPTDGSGTAHENRPPYYALTYIIKK